MSVTLLTLPKKELHQLGITQNNLHYQSGPDELIQDTLRRGEGVLNNTGALVIKTGEFTGRSPKDKFIVRDEQTMNTVHWNEFNLPIEEKYFANGASTALACWLAPLSEEISWKNHLPALQ